MFVDCSHETQGSSLKDHVSLLTINFILFLGLNTNRNIDVKIATSVNYSLYPGEHFQVTLPTK